MCTWAEQAASKLNSDVVFLQKKWFIIVDCHVYELSINLPITCFNWLLKICKFANLAFSLTLHQTKLGGVQIFCVFLAALQGSWLGGAR